MVYETLIANHRKVVIAPMVAGLLIALGAMVLGSGGLLFYVGIALYGAAGYLHFGLLFYSDLLEDDVDEPLKTTVFALALITLAALGILFLVLLGLSFL